jgi:hypothetical protein
MSDWVYSSDLCGCGQPKKKSSRRCANCASASPSPEFVRKYKTCPGCGGYMSPKAKLCRGCAHPVKDPNELGQTRPWYGEEPDYSHVPEDFLRAFAGFFMGEGCVRIKTRPYSLLVDIGLHEADRRTLELCQHYFGGSFQVKNYNHQCSWRLQGIRNVAELMKLVIEYAGPLESIKMKDAQIAVDYANFRLSLPQHLNEEQKQAIEEWRSLMSSVKVRA